MLRFLQRNIRILAAAAVPTGAHFWQQQHPHLSWREQHPGSSIWTPTLCMLRPAAGAPGGKMPWINSIAADNRERQGLRERPPRAKCGLDSEQTEGFVRSAEAAAAEAAQDARDAAAAEVAGVAAEWRAARRQAPFTRCFTTAAVVRVKMHTMAM